MRKRMIVQTHGARDTYEGWLDRDRFTVRRKVQLSKGTRKAKPRRYELFGGLKKLKFEGAHIWALNWGGREVNRLFWALPEVNNSIQKRAENATRRFAERLEGTGTHLYVTATAKKYGQLRLLERITYHYEVVAPDDRVLDLGKVEITQKLSFEQRRALVEGRPVVIDPDDAVGFDSALRLDRADELERAFQRFSEDPPDTELDLERSRGTSDRGVDETPTKAPASPTSGIGDIDKKPSGRDAHSSKATVEAPRIKQTFAKSVLKFGKGLLIDQLVDLAIALFVGYFQRRVTEENMRMLRIRWRQKIATEAKLEERVRYWIARSAAGHTFDLAEDQKYVYVEVQWTLMLRELREDAADVVVWFGKFFAQDPGFGEVYHGVRLDRGPNLYMPRDGTLAEDRMEDREPNRSEVGVNDYTFSQYFLVHDPDMLANAKRMFSHAQEVEARFNKVLQEWRSAPIRFEPPGDLVAEVRTALDKYQFRKASAAMDRLASAMDETSMSTTALKKLSVFTTSVVFLNPSFWPKKHRDLLDAYLGVHLESDVSVEPTRSQAPRSGRSSTHHTIDNPGQKFP